MMDPEPPARTYLKVSIRFNPIPPHGHCTHTNVLPTSVLPTIDLPTHDCLPTRIPLTFDPPSVAGLTLAGPMDSR